jgi:hypothetical protein
MIGLVRLGGIQRDVSALFCEEESGACEDYEMDELGCCEVARGCSL